MEFNAAPLRLTCSSSSWCSTGNSGDEIEAETLDRGTNQMLEFPPAPFLCPENATRAGKESSSRDDYIIIDLEEEDDDDDLEDEDEEIEEFDSRSDQEPISPDRHDFSALDEVANDHKEASTSFHSRDKRHIPSPTSIGLHSIKSEATAIARRLCDIHSPSKSRRDHSPARQSEEIEEFIQLSPSLPDESQQDLLFVGPSGRLLPQKRLFSGDRENQTQPSGSLEPQYQPSEQGMFDDEIIDDQDASQHDSTTTEAHQRTVVGAATSQQSAAVTSIPSPLRLFKHYLSQHPNVPSPISSPSSRWLHSIATPLKDTQNLVESDRRGPRLSRGVEAQRLHNALFRKQRDEIRLRTTLASHTLQSVEQSPFCILSLVSCTEHFGVLHSFCMLHSVGDQQTLCVAVPLTDSTTVQIDGPRFVRVIFPIEMATRLQLAPSMVVAVLSWLQTEVDSFICISCEPLPGDGETKQHEQSGLLRSALFRSSMQPLLLAESELCGWVIGQPEVKREACRPVGWSRRPDRLQRQNHREQTPHWRVLRLLPHQQSVDLQLEGCLTYGRFSSGKWNLWLWDSEQTTLFAIDLYESMHHFSIDLEGEGDALGHNSQQKHASLSISEALMTGLSLVQPLRSLHDLVSSTGDHKAVRLCTLICGANSSLHLHSNRSTTTV